MIAPSYPNKKFTFSKAKLVNNYYRSFLARLSRMFVYKGLPETIPQRDLELMLLNCGSVFITDKAEPGKLYAFWGNAGGPPSPYYMPTLAVIANPALNFSASLEIGRDCVWVPSDSLYQGLHSILQQYSVMLAEVYISMRSVAINGRAMNIMAAGDDRTAQGVKQFLTDLEEGTLAYVSESTAISDGIRSLPYYSMGTSTLQQLIELQQYLKASLYNDLGLSANYNLKREAIGAGESAQNFQALLPLMDDMLHCRQKAFAEVNEKYGTNISVEFGSAWELTRDAAEAATNVFNTSEGNNTTEENNAGEEPAEGEPEAIE